MCAGSNNNGWSRARGLVVKTLVLIGGAILVKRFTKSTTRWDHARIVSQSLAGEKFSRDQASRDPDNFFNLRWLSCPAAEMVDGSKVLYFEQRFYMVKPCPKEMKFPLFPECQVHYYLIPEPRCWQLALGHGKLRQVLLVKLSSLQSRLVIGTLTVLKFITMRKR